MYSVRNSADKGFTPSKRAFFVGTWINFCENKSPALEQHVVFAKVFLSPISNSSQVLLYVVV